MKTITMKISAGQQSVDYAETLDANGTKLRISIKSDAYAAQSHARLEVFSPVELRWNNLVTLHHGAMATAPGLVYRPSQGGLDPAHFAADRDEMVRQAAEILDLETGPAPSGPCR
jgi:hypothetical protein